MRDENRTRSAAQRKICRELLTARFRTFALFPNWFHLLALPCAEWPGVTAVVIVTEKHGRGQTVACPISPQLAGLRGACRALHLSSQHETCGNGPTIIWSPLTSKGSGDRCRSIRSSVRKCPMEPEGRSMGDMGRRSCCEL